MALPLGPIMPPAALLVLGTANRKKALELRELLEPLGFHIKTLADYPHALSVEETGDSFAANAALKAAGQARHLDAWVLGEDSGLVVDVLGGAPGIYSARYAGPHATDDQNNHCLLAELVDVPHARRTAHFVCHWALSDPSGTIRAEGSGRCTGRIRFEPAGTAGFGYDPLFEIVEYHRTFGELGQSVKLVLSHRARAVEKLVPRLIELRDSGPWV
ncbi:MAG TPA: RdgB/HAM1 family non-canonical purine NTP pyrophosphatase [Pirellulales bacterium]|nr:RdgB/HAM1 family non-canonical purine NTP pyrophosphatase [Pirellulales bacterium]